MDGWPEPIDTPQNNYEDTSTWNVYSYYGIQRFNIDRHSGGVSVVYMDGSCVNVGLKVLWKLKWHKKFDTNNAQTLPTANWPEWMRRFKDNY